MIEWRSLMAKYITVEVEPESELAHVVRQTDVVQVTLVSEGRFFDLVERRNAGWDPASIRAHLHQYAGFLSQEEADQMKDDIYRRRRDGSR
jgi:hypothetical protein